MQRPLTRDNFAPAALIVMGVCGSGKSTLGATLARQLECDFFEGDAFHDGAAIAKMGAGEPLCDEDRWPWLDRLGAALGQAVSARGIAVAACSALKRSYRDRLRQVTRAPTGFILLENDHDELVRRLANRSGHYMPLSLLDSQLATLEPPRADELSFSIEASQSPDALCERTVDWLQAGGLTLLNPR